MSSGWALLNEGRAREALELFKEANKLEGGSSPHAHWGLAQTRFNLGEYKEAAKTCEQVLRLTNDRVLQARAWNLKGVALTAHASTKKKELQEAEEAFRQVLKLGVALPVVHYNLGVVLLKLGRDAEGVAELETFLKSDPDETTAGNARRLIDNPRRAREDFAPDFSFTTLEGETLALEDLAGRVVLVDFWGVWCHTCVAQLPELKKLAKRYSADPFVLLSISSDRDEKLWLDFVRKEGMVWPQVLDQDRELQNLFSVNVFPTYLVIDPEGIVRARSTTLPSVTLHQELKRLAKSQSDR